MLGSEHLSDVSIHIDKVIEAGDELENVIDYASCGMDKFSLEIVLSFYVCL